MRLRLPSHRGPVPKVRRGLHNRLRAKAGGPIDRHLTGSSSATKAA